MNLKISAIICTHNRAVHLQKAIESLLNQSIPKRKYEIIIVDNGSTDSTKKVVEQLSSGNNIRYIYESNLGLCYSRNTGWQNARAKYIAYLDDDAIASQVWLERILEIFETVKPTPGCVGGKVEPIWKAPRPRWLSDELITCLTVIDWSDRPFVLPDLYRKWLVGANIAFPVEILKCVGGFNCGLDRKGKKLLSSGDVFLQKQIINAGYSCYYHPEISISHLIPISRLNKRWFLRRYYWQGQSDAVMQLLEDAPSKKECFCIALSKFITLLKSPKKLKILISPTDEPKEFTEKCFTLITVGHIMALLNSRRK